MDWLEAVWNVMEVSELMREDEMEPIVDLRVDVG